MTHRIISAKPLDSKDLDAETIWEDGIETGRKPL